MEVQQLDDYFGYTEKGSSLEGEIRAGVTTFLTMAYILLVNPALLSVAGLPFSDVLFATALAAFVGCVVMGTVGEPTFRLSARNGTERVFRVRGRTGDGCKLAASIVRGLRRGTPIPSHVNATDTNNRNMEITDDQLHSH